MTVVIIALFALFLLYPLISLFLSGFKDTETGVWTIDNYARFFSKKYYKSALLNSFKLTFSVTVAQVSFNPHQLFDTIYISFKPMADSKKLELNYHCNESLNRVYIGDPFRSSSAKVAGSTASAASQATLSAPPTAGTTPNAPKNTTA